MEQTLEANSLWIQKFFSLFKLSEVEETDEDINPLDGVEAVEAGLFQIVNFKMKDSMKEGPILDVWMVFRVVLTHGWTQMIKILISSKDHSHIM